MPLFFYLSIFTKLKKHLKVNCAAFKFKSRTACNEL